MCGPDAVFIRFRGTYGLKLTVQDAGTRCSSALNQSGYRDISRPLVRSVQASGASPAEVWYLFGGYRRIAANVLRHRIDEGHALWRLETPGSDPIA
jgi:hypothetical protein